MLTNEDLLAISRLFDERLDAKLDAKFDERLGPIEKDIAQLKAEQRRTNLILENDVIPRLDNIESCYVSTYERYARGADQIEALQMDMDIVKKVLQEHSQKLSNMT